MPLQEFITVLFGGLVEVSFAVEIALTVYTVDDDGVRLLEKLVLNFVEVIFNELVFIMKVFRELLFIKDVHFGWSQALDLDFYVIFQEKKPMVDHGSLREPLNRKLVSVNFRN